MKVALCLSGLGRFIEENFKNIERCILNELNPDVFLHTWEEINKELGIVPQRAVDLYLPKKHIIEKQVVFPKHSYEHIKDFEQYNDVQMDWMFQRVNSMFYSIKVANDLKSKYENENNMKYDCVIRFRTDVIPPLPLGPELECGDSLWSHMYPAGQGGYHPAAAHGNKFGFTRLLADQTAWGTSQVMNEYSSCFDNLEGSIKELNRIHAGSILTYHALISKKLSVKSNRFLDAAQDKIVRNPVVHERAAWNMTRGEIPEY